MMQQYNIRVTSTLKVVLTIVLVPTLTITPTIILGTLYGPQLPDWAIYTIIYSLLVLGGLATLAIVKRSSPRAVMTIYDDGFSVDFADKSFFAPPSFSLKISEIKNFSIEGNGSYDYMSFSTSARPSSFNVSAAGKTDAEQDAFSELEERMTEMIVKYNETRSNNIETINTASMYAKGFMKALAVVFIILLLAVVATNLFMPARHHVPWWRAGVLLIFGLPLVYKVWYNGYAKKM